MGNANSAPQSPPYDGLPPVEVSDYETSPLPRDRRLKHLLRLNHQDHAVLFSSLRFHNHIPHSLGSAYLLGADAEHLSLLYDHEAESLEPWVDSPHEVCRHDWRDFLSKRNLQRGYLDFFEDELVRMGYEWKRVVVEYLFKGPEPVIFGGIGGGELLPPQLVPGFFWGGWLIGGDSGASAYPPWGEFLNFSRIGSG